MTCFVRVFTIIAFKGKILHTHRTTQWIFNECSLMYVSDFEQEIVWGFLYILVQYMPISYFPLFSYNSTWCACSKFQISKKILHNMTCFLRSIRFVKNLCDLPSKIKIIFSKKSPCLSQRFLMKFPDVMTIYLNSSSGSINFWKTPPWISTCKTNS